MLLLGDMSFQDFGDCTFGFTTRTGKCVKMVYAIRKKGMLKRVYKKRKNLDFLERKSDFQVFVF